MIWADKLFLVGDAGRRPAACPEGTLRGRGRVREGALTWKGAGGLPWKILKIGRSKMQFGAF